MNGERQESALWRCSFFLPDIALSSVPSGADTTLLLATEPLAGYLRHPAALARLSGDFLTQFFYYEGGGPAIMAVVLLLWGVVVFRLLVPYMGRWAWIPTVLAVAWEAGRQCGLSYPLSGTIALTGIGGVLLLCRSCMRRSWKSGLAVSILAVLSGYWLFGCGDWSSRWYNMPDLGREYLLALDSEMYFGRSEKYGNCWWRVNTALRSLPIIIIC